MKSLKVEQEPELSVIKLHKPPTSALRSPSPHHVYTKSLESHQRTSACDSELYWKSEWFNAESYAEVPCNVSFVHLSVGLKPSFLIKLMVRAGSGLSETSKSFNAAAISLDCRGTHDTWIFFQWLYLTELHCSRSRITSVATSWSWILTDYDKNWIV